VGDFKSKSAAKSAQKMNPSFKINVITNAVGKNTEFQFNDKFYEDLDLVVIATTK